MGLQERCYGSLAWGKKEGSYLSSDAKLVWFSFLYHCIVFFVEPFASDMNFHLNLQDIFRLKFMEEGWSQTSSSNLEAKYL